MTSALAGCGGGGASGIMPSGTAYPSAAVPAPQTVNQAAVTAGQTTGAYAQQVMADNPLAYYRLNETAAVLNDSTSNHLNGVYGSAVVHGGGIFTSNADPAAKFPGGTSSTTRVASVPAATIFQQRAVSVEAWISENAVDSTVFMPVVEYGRDVNGSPFSLELTPLNTVEFRLHTGTSTANAETSTVLVPGVVYHLIGTYDGSTARIYVNGQLQATTASAYGMPNYGTNDGLAIGGGLELEGHKLLFNGSVSDVSVYKYALSSAQALNHYVAGVYAPPTTETPVSADAFVDSIGVNTHLSDVNSLYVQYPAFKSLITGLGIRHIRDAMPGSVSSFVTGRFNDLAASGIHSTLTTSPSFSDTYLEEYPGDIPASFEAYEGPNEPDDQGNPNWVAPTLAFMQRLHQDVVTTPTVAAYPIIAPALVNIANVQSLGNISGLVSYGNMHDYFSGYNPGTTGWGSLGPSGYYYGSLGYTMSVAAMEAGSHPIMSTETGYGVYPPGTIGNVSLPVLAKYVPRLFLEQFKHGVARTFIYEFFDQNDSGAKFTNYGLVDLNANPKPSYTALRALIGQLRDPGPALAPKPVTYTITGNVTNVHHLLMQKHDGTYWLAIWIETPSWDATKNVPITVAPQSVTIQAPGAVRTVNATTLDAGGNLTSAAATLNSAKTSISLSVTDQVTLLHIGT